MSPDEVLDTLRSQADPLLAGALVRLGARPDSVLGVDLAALEDLARGLRPDHDLAVQLWKAGFRETRLLAAAIADPQKLEAGQARTWVAETETIEVADYLVIKLLEKSPVGRELAPAWSLSAQEMERHVGFLLMARLSIDDAGHPEARFPGYFAPLADLSHETEAAHGTGGGPAADGGGFRRSFRALLRFLGRRNRRQAWKAVQHAREAELALSSQRDPRT